MSRWEHEPVYKYPELRLEYYERARRCRSLDNQRTFIIKHQSHLPYMMKEHERISDKLDRLWQENIDLYDKANEKIIKQ